MNNINFNLTNEMIDILLIIIKIKERLSDNNLNENYKKILEKQFVELRKQFIYEFQRNNKEEIRKYNEIKDTNN